MAQKSAMNFLGLLHTFFLRYPWLSGANPDEVEFGGIYQAIVESSPEKLAI